MAKRKLKMKLGKVTDWKFIILLLGILLVGLSVFVLNQKVTYKSSAASFNYEVFRDCMNEPNATIEGCLAKAKGSGTGKPSTGHTIDPSSQNNGGSNQESSDNQQNSNTNSNSLQPVDPLERVDKMLNQNED